jgi:hypothetical protein
MKSPDEPCPACKGVGRALNPGVDFDVMLDPDYAAVPAGKTWSGTFFVCATCAGSGKLSDALARTLSGLVKPRVPGATA